MTDGASPGTTIRPCSSEQRTTQAVAFYDRHGYSVVSRGIGRVGLPKAQYAWTPPSGRARKGVGPSSHNRG